ncbi:MAG: GNAT family N-acetyltransferase [Planctomycetota bacterium]
MTGTSTITTDRLTLRPLELSDAGRIEQLAGDARVALMTANIPHPYPPGAAEEFIRQVKQDIQCGRSVLWAIAPRGEDALVGTIALRIDRKNAIGEIGYWVGVPYWGQGYAGEAATAVVRSAFETLGLEEVEGCHLVGNPASGRVMAKAGMRRKGTIRKALGRWDENTELIVYRLTREQWDKRD